MGKFLFKINGQRFDSMRVSMFVDHVFYFSSIIFLLIVFFFNRQVWWRRSDLNVWGCTSSRYPNRVIWLKISTVGCFFFLSLSFGPLPKNDVCFPFCPIFRFLWIRRCDWDGKEMTNPFEFDVREYSMAGAIKPSSKTFLHIWDRNVFFYSFCLKIMSLALKIEIQYRNDLVFIAIVNKMNIAGSI